MKPLLAIITLLITSTFAFAGWLPREIHEVRAYVYDYTQGKGNSSLLKYGKIHKGVINDGGAKLDEKQIDRLKEAIRSSKERVPGVFCYMPHHAFVFFDKNGKPMGHIELCFQCGNVDSSPRGLPDKEWNWKEIKSILIELKIPFKKTDKDYTALYNNKQVQKKEAKLNKQKKENKSQ